MNFPRFWASATEGTFTTWRSSNDSPSAAQAAARAAVRTIAERSAHGETELDDYRSYERPLREPVLREFKDEAGDVHAAITRNSYGALILNAARLMFVDVDLPGADEGPTLFDRLLGRRSEPPEAQPVARAEAWTRMHPGWGWRVYRTRAGLRLLATHAEIDPLSPTTIDAFEALGADPLYRRLCKTQRSFRARLSPKPWRCDLDRPPARWPWEDERAEARFAEWESKYVVASAEHATCAFLATLGVDRIDARLRPLIEFHDHATHATSKLPLA